MKLSLHFGLNIVSPAAYGGWSGELRGCHNDAIGWEQLANSRGFETETFLDEECTLEHFVATLREAAREAHAGDTVLITYSGHGSQLPNPAEPDGRDETLCLWDGELRDDELRALFAAFRPGVTVAAMLDCCHSGGLDRALTEMRGRYMPHRVAEHLAMTRPLPRPATAPLAEIRAGIVLFTACREHEVAADGERFGAFTGSALRAWSSLWLRPTWQRWFEKTERECRRANPAQHPNVHRLGANIWRNRAL